MLTYSRTDIAGCRSVRTQEQEARDANQGRDREAWLGCSMLEAQAEDTRGCCFLVRRNCSIAPLPLCAITLALCAVTVVVAAFWASQGAWLILPFAGIESAALVSALVWISRHVGDFERISVRDDETVVVEVCETNRVQRYEFDRSWARLVSAGDGDRLALRSRGEELEIGRHLDENDRERLRAQLSRWLTAEEPRRR